LQAEGDDTTNKTTPRGQEDLLIIINLSHPKLFEKEVGLYPVYFISPHCYALLRKNERSSELKNGMFYFEGTQIIQ
jgi:hypothetical protein